MKNLSPGQVALLSSIVTSLITLLLLLLLHLTVSSFSSPWYVLIGLPVLVWGVGFFVFLYALEIFIYRKIKLIYKTIHNLKADKENTQYIDVLRDDTFQAVESEVRQWAESKVAEIRDLREMAEYRKEFLGNVSHELKTPIFNIQGYLQTLEDGGLEDEQINRTYLAKANRNVERLEAIVNDLEFISRFESGVLQLEQENFDLCDLIKEVLESMEMQADVYDIDLTIKTGCQSSREVFADRDRIRQVLINLISNSIKYGKDGGETKISVYDMDENLLVEVTDNGIGMEEKDLKRIFERFYRVDKSRSRNQGGTGLGLSIVKHIIEAHEQTINTRSKPGLGTTIGFTLKKA